MGQRIPSTSQMIDLAMDQHRQGYIRQGASILVGAPGSYPQPNFPTLVTSSGSTAYLDSQYLPEHYDSSMSYGMNRSSHVHHQCNSDLNFSTPGSFYYSYGTSHASNGVLGVPLNHAIPEQLTSSSNRGVIPIGYSQDNYTRLHSHYLDESRGPSKRKNAEGYPGNFQHSYGSAGSSSSVIHPEEVAVVDATSLSASQYRGNVIPGNDRNNHLIAGTTLDQHLQLAGKGRVSSSNHPSARNYMHGSNSNGSSLETQNQRVNGYHETSFWHPHMNNWPHNHHHLSGSTSVQGMRGHNVNYHAQVPPALYRFPSNYSRSTVNFPRDSSEIGNRQLGPVPPTGLRVSRPHRGALFPATTIRHGNLPHLRVLQADEVALLEIPDFYEVSNFVDHHRDLRLDIEDMSYEELLELGDRIGSVNTGLSEEIITCLLKTKNYESAATPINQEDAPFVDKEVFSCIICQENYLMNETIGILNCGHEYHADCLKKWLIIKNVCPICKSEALAERKDG